MATGYRYCLTVPRTLAIFEPEISDSAAAAWVYNEASSTATFNLQSRRASFQGLQAYSKAVKEESSCEEVWPHVDNAFTQTACAQYC